MPGILTASGPRLSELAYFPFELPVLKSSLNKQNQVFVMNRFRNVVEGSVLRRTNGIATGRFSRHHDHSRVALTSAQSLQNRESIDIGQPYVEQDQVRPLLQRELISLLSRLCFEDLVPLIGKQQRESL
jgi:hypothetical protein